MSLSLCGRLSVPAQRGTLRAVTCLLARDADCLKVTPFLRECCWDFPEALGSGLPGVRAEGARGGPGRAHCRGDAPGSPGPTPFQTPGRHPCPGKGLLISPSSVLFLLGILSLKLSSGAIFFLCVGVTAQNTRSATVVSTVYIRSCVRFPQRGRQFSVFLSLSHLLVYSWKSLQILKPKTSSGPPLECLVTGLAGLGGGGRRNPAGSTLQITGSTLQLW